MHSHHCTAKPMVHMMQSRLQFKLERRWSPTQHQCAHPLVERSLKATSSRLDSVKNTELTPKIRDLINATKGQAFGASSTSQQKEHLKDLVAGLKDLHQAAHKALDPTEGPLSGHWQLLWTSEASVHSIVRGQLLGAPVTDIQQQVDLQSQRVTNTISFGWLGLQLQASGPLTVLNSSRIYYSFDKLTLKVLQLPLSLPLLFKGGGWTDCVLLLDDGAEVLRVMENSRRDTLVLQRVEE